MTTVPGNKVLVFILFLLIRFINGHCDLLIDDRVDCGYAGISKIECEDRNCCWMPFSAEDLRNPPWCIFPQPDYCGFARISPNKLQDRCNSSRLVDILVENISEDILRVKLTRSHNEFQVPYWIYPEIKINYSNDYKLKFQEFSDKNGNFNFKITRNNSNFVLWNTDLADSFSSSSFRMKSMYTQVGSIIPLNHSIYGLGYHAGSLKINPVTRLTLFARDSPTLENQNLYGVHPFYMEIRNGSAHGVYLRNSFGMDVIINKNQIKFKALGGPIDLFFFAGPSPLKVLEQYTRIIGRPPMFDYRVLGFHQSRYGYKNISQILDVVQGFESEHIPLDTIWFDIDYMDKKKDFTLDEVNFPNKKLESLVDHLLKSHIRIVPILDPGIKIEKGYCPYLRGLEKGVFIKNPKNLNPYTGEVWPGLVHFIDFSAKNAFDYWNFEIKTFINRMFKNSSDVFGGLWLDMNEPSNFIDGYNYNFNDMPEDYTNYSLNFPRYMINNDGAERPIYSKTIPLDAITALGTSYESHNMYGLFESMITYKSILEMEPNKRPFLLTRSTFPGSGRWAATWLGDNFSTFPQMALSIAGVLQYGLEGISLSGPDICGFIGNASEELCARWMALGSFYPFARNHNSIDSKVDQEPFRSKVVADISRKYLYLRYALFPYYYTLMHLANVRGWPIWRPVFFYDSSSSALDINDQFFIGSAFLVSPVLKESSKSMKIRLPVGEWYELESYNFIKSSLSSLIILYDTPIDYMPLHLRSGNIIVMQTPKLTAFETRKTNFTLLIALNSSGEASGDFYWDDGVSLNVGDKFVDIQLRAKVSSNNELLISYSGIFGLIECPFVEKLVVLTAGNKVSTKQYRANYKVIEKDYGIDLIFKDLKKLKELNHTKILL